MKNKKSLTENILNNIVVSEKKTKQTPICVENMTQNIKDRTSVKLDLNSFIMVPTNHPKINEIINLLNNFDDINNKNQNKLEEKKEISRTIITLNDISNSNKESIDIPDNSIITPMALDYIKLKKIKLRYTK